ncbi:MAG: cellulose synthase catalytic subunit [Candidatus Saccharibacteria bacterium]|nr:cellulose synthase catalytic subunit [Candidatus Saccharibacteria bacterium]
MNKHNVERASLPKILLFSLTLITTIVYIIYRLIFTIPFDLRLIDIVFGIIVVVIELIEIFEFCVYFENTLIHKKSSPKTPKASEKDFPDVDVFIATFNEESELLEKTISACKNMKYPDAKKLHIYLCDDGNRKEIKQLAKKNKIEYITRDNNNFAKAGNYNNAIKKSGSPLIAVFDADMQPSKNFLMKTVPFFVAEEKIGFVQTPQSFKNPDIFQARLSKHLPFEQDYFYHYIQLARNNNNSTILCGTNCVISREALKSVGGFSTATIAEDIATGMLIESKGYRAIAISDVLAYGEATNNLNNFLKQRSRWGRGCIQTAKAYEMFRLKGLSLRQKLDYFVAINYWCFGLRRMLYMILPLLFAFFGIIAIQGDLVVFLPIFLVQFVLRRFLIDTLEGSYSSSTWTKIFEIIQAPFMSLVVLKEIMGFSSKKFTVTPKGKSAKKGHADAILFIVHAILIAANITGIVLSIQRIQNENLAVFIIPLIWMVINAIYLSVALIFDLRKNKNYANFKPNTETKYHAKSYLGIIARGK